MHIDLTDTPVAGSCDRRFHALQQVLTDAVISGRELGASLVVDIDGKTVVDLWGGWRDSERTDPWTRDTIVNVWSTTKTITNLAALMLIDRGQLDPNAPVARYWPEFAAAGKENVIVRQVLSHTSGVSGWEAPFAIEDVYDRERATDRLATQAPWWEPGSASGYQASNHGHLIGELVRRVTGSTLTDFIAQEIAEPLDADFQIGARAVDWPRIAAVVAPPPISIELAPGSPAAKSLTEPPIDARYANTPEWRSAEIGACNGHGNARSVARIVGALSRDGVVDGVRLLSPQTIELIFDEQSHGVDLVLGIPLRFGIGYALPEQVTCPYVPQGRTCYWGGWGGSMAVCDLDRRVTFSYMMNQMSPGIIGSDNARSYLTTLERCLMA